jgi:hypothetical protein
MIVILDGEERSRGQLRPLVIFFYGLLRRG